MFALRRVTSRSSRAFARSSRYRLRLTRPTRRQFSRVPRLPSEGPPETLQTCSRESWDQNNLFSFLIFWDVYVYGPLKTLKSSLEYQILPGVLSRSHSDHWGPVSAQVYLKKWCFGYYMPPQKHDGPPQAVLVCLDMICIHAISIWYRYHNDMKSKWYR